MNATVLDLRRNMKRVLAAIDRNEAVTLTHRGRKKAIIVPCQQAQAERRVDEHPAFGMWADRDDMADVAAYVRKLRKGRF
jgi:antitoxin (DNA-binding transcriptional repressor) of toxin-antitoxin stability system